MIYLIDEKTERQSSYGWTNERFIEYKSKIARVKNYNELKDISSQVILDEGNVVLLHDSFFKNLNISEKDEERFKNKIKESKNIKSYVLFGGSYDSVYVKDSNLEIKDDVFYSHLETYLNSENKKVEIFAYGENFKLEEFCHLKNEIWTYLFLLDDKHLLNENEKYEIQKISNYDERIKEILKNKISVLFLKTKLNKWRI